MRITRNVGKSNSLEELGNELVDLNTAETSFATFTEVDKLVVHTTSATDVTTKRTAKLERPKKVVGLLEVGATGEDFVNQIFHAYNARISKVLLDDHVVSDGNALLVDLGVATFVA